MAKRVNTGSGKKHKLSGSAQEVYMMLTEQMLRPAEIARRRHTSPAAVSKIIKKLKQKGLLDSIGNRGLQKVPHVSIKGLTNFDKITTKEWHLHNLHFVIRPYYFFPRYERIRKEKGNYSIKYREWTFKLHEGMVEMQLQEQVRFSDPDKWECSRMGETSFNRALREFAERYGFSVWKQGKANIKKVNGHLARNPSEIADAKDGEHLTLKGKDGKIWFVIDKSDGNEHEYVHPDRQYTDSERIEPYLNDMLYKQPGTLSELQDMISETSKQVHTITIELHSMMKNLSMMRKEEQPKERPDYFG